MFSQPHQFAGLHQRIGFVLRVVVVAPASALMRDAAVGERSGVILIEDADLWARAPAVDGCGSHTFTPFVCVESER